MFESIKKQLAQWDQCAWNGLGFERLGGHLSREKGWVAFLVIMALIAHAFDLFNFTLSIDDELHAQESGAKLAWAQQSRWGMYLANQLILPDTIFPFVPMFIALLFIALAANFVTKIFTTERSVVDYPTAALFIACPTLYFVLSFETLGYGVGIGWFASALGMYLYFCQAGRKRYWAIPLLAFSFAIYQAFILSCTVLFEFYLLSCILGARKMPSGNDYSFKDMMGHVLSFVFLMICAFAFYYLVNKAYFYYFEFPANDYLSGFVDVEWNLGYMNKAWNGIYSAFTGYYFGEAQFYVTEIVELRWLFITALALTVIAILFSPVSIVIKGLGLLLLLTTLFTPFLMNIMNGGFMPGRTLLGIPVVIAGLAFFAARTPVKILKSLLVILMAIVAFRFVIANNRLAFSEYMTREADRELMTQILVRAGDVVNKLPDHDVHHQPWPTVLVGYHRYMQSPTLFERNSIGASFFAWGGDVRRIVSVLRIMGYDDYRAANPDEHRKVMEYALTMPVWPVAGSVDVHEGVLIIKMEEYISHQLESGCAKDESTRICHAFYECKRNKTEPYCERTIVKQEK